MPEAVVSNRIFFRPNSTEELKRIASALTYRIEDKKYTNNKLKNIEVIKNYKLLLNNVISIPQGRFDLIPTTHTVVDKRILAPAPFPLPKTELRPDQQEVCDAIEDSCFINALVGWGKTFTALHIARKLGQKTLVITHTTMLRDQWVEEVKKLFDMEAGVIGSRMRDYEDRAITIGNVQTVTKLIPELQKEFGTIILDEAHHVPATTFSDIVDGMHARYRIALSGTMERKDGKHVIFKDYFGPKVLRPPQSNTLNPTVKIIKTGIKLAAGMPWTQRMNLLLYDEAYQKFIASLARTQINKGHTVLVVADRTQFLERVKEFIGEDCILVTGETEFEQRKKLLDKIDIGEKMCVAGSRQIFSEGISANRLSCLILAVPTGNTILLEQLIGRIMRMHKDKLDPVVLDLNFSSATEKRQNSTRKGFYLGKGWKIEEV